MRGAVFQGAVLHFAMWHGAVLDGAFLRGAVLHGAMLHGAMLHGAFLRGAMLRGARCRGGVVLVAPFLETTFRGAVFHGWRAAPRERVEPVDEGLSCMVDVGTILAMDTINVALVGCGGMANWHAQQLKAIESVKVVALVDTVEKQTALFKEKYFPDAVAYQDYDRLLHAPPAELHAVNLVTPHTVHYHQAKAALEHGINVLCEKPMVTSVTHAYDLWRTQKKSGKLLGVTFQAPYTATFGWLAQHRDAGEWGKVQVVSGWLAQNWRDYTVGSWRQEPSLSGGGQMYDSGAHLLNAIMWLMNEPVVSVSCFYDKVGTPVDINGVAILRFASGALGSIAIGGHCSGDFKTGIHIQTDRFLIETDQYGGRLDMSTHRGRKYYPAVPHNDHPSAGSPHLNFIRALRGQEPLRAPTRYGVLLSAMMDALYESADTGKIVSVEPVPKDLEA